MQQPKRPWSRLRGLYDSTHLRPVFEGPVDESRLAVDDLKSRSISEPLLPTTARNPLDAEKATSRSVSIRRKSDLPRNGTNTGSLLPGEKSYNDTQPGGRTSDPLGLFLVHDVAEPHGDIILVHGLGGTAIKTWCWDRDEQNFWPAWLHREEGLESYRVFTFGYNSNFKGPGTNLNMTDFAKSLLQNLLTSDGILGGRSAPIGTQPIVIVAHSMGGLVAKKAYVLGKHDAEFSHIISKIHGIIFLATPHRGTNNAKTLNHILSSAPIGAPPKDYIADLDMHSSAVQDINEQFRGVCGELALVSFFETLKTNFKIHKLHIVDKTAGVLGYPQEKSDGLDADHHSICKYRSREDSNYLRVKNEIRHWASKISQIRSNLHSIKRAVNTIEVLKEIQSITGVRENADDELKIHQNRILSGTCSWLTETIEFTSWLASNNPNGTIFRLIGQPATGKSTLSAYVIDHLKSLGHRSQYHFFSNGHQNKRTAAYCLRSIATQLAISSEEFRKRLFSLHEDTGIVFSSQDQNFNVIWDQLFEGIIFKMTFEEPLYWVLDAIDEADTPFLLMNSLFNIKSISPIKIFLTSRNSQGSHFRGPSVTTLTLNVRNTANDIRRYVQSAVQAFIPNNNLDMQNSLAEKILDKAEGSFLWVRLALETLQSNWHTLEDIQRALTDVPEGMDPLYERMLDLIELQTVRQRQMAKTILTWAVCSWRPLSIGELQSALQPKFSDFVNLQETIVQICGHFIIINGGRITLIHATARQFLLLGNSRRQAFIDEEDGHTQIAKNCLSHLSDDLWKRVFKTVGRQNNKENVMLRTNLLIVAEKDHHFLGYSTCYWAYHVSKASLDSSELSLISDTFLSKYCLSWIEGIALSKNLRYLTRSAQFLKAFAKRQRRHARNNPLLTSPISTDGPKSQNIQLWATDFVRIVGKFGHNLMQSPASIHRLVPPFCPRDSMIGRVYGTSPDKPFSVSGLLYRGWDDCLASVRTGDGKYVIQILATDAFFITVRSGTRGPIDTYFADTCALARTLHHGECIRRARLNRTRTILATAGEEHYRIWNVVTGEALYHMPNDTTSLPLAITFGASDTELMVGLDNCTVRCYDFERVEAFKWCYVTPRVRDEFWGPPKIINFSPDLQKVAMSWRGKPPVVFDISTKDSRAASYQVLNTHAALLAADRIKWKQDSSSVLMLCENTKLIEWHVYDEEQHIHENVKAREMTVSRDGDLLLTSDSAGNISVWSFPQLHLIYRLENENEFVRNITLSPDAQRIYRTTDTICSVIEPDALVRPDELELEELLNQEASSPTTEAVIMREDGGQSRVTSLAYGFRDTLYCAGRDDGSVQIHDIDDGRKVWTVSRHDSTSSIIALYWSYSNKYIVSGDDAGHLLIKRLRFRERVGFKISDVFDVRLRFTIHQLFMNNDEELLLISTSDSDEVWSLNNEKRLCQEIWEERQGRQWLQHPSNADLLMWVEPTSVHFHEWRTLKKVETIDIKSHEWPIGPSHSTQGRRILWIALTSNKKYIIFLADGGHPSTRLSNGLHLEFLSTEDFQFQPTHALSDESMTDLASQIVRLVGTYQNQILFLDHDLWLCTWQIDAGVNEVKRHFFLPMDWGSPSSLEMAALNNQGTFFCPKRGAVGIVRHGMKF